MNAFLEDEEYEDEDGDPTEPEEEDWITADYVSFYECGGKDRIHVPEGEDWRKVLKARMDEDQFWPNVWVAEERGGFHLADWEDE